ncbi:MAG: lipopolysaccharide heptosyltransferase I [Thermodesulfobacteriota bacterium]|nr:lipopolysaccharide heptosyltransferase I [Thermodesulfobacteriota bacterium]
MNILIVKLSAVGDVVQSLPFLEALRRAFPQARLTWLVEEAASGIITGHPLLDRVIISRRKHWQKELKKGRIRSTLGEVVRFRRDLRAEKFDLVIDLQGLFKSGILVYLSGGRRRIGFDRSRELSYLFMNERLAPYDPDRHALLRYLDVAAYLGADTNEVKFNLPVNRAAAAEAENLLAGTGPRFVAINPGAKWTTKLWPFESWIELCRRLVDDSRVQVVLTGGPDECAVNKRIALEAGGVLDLTGKTSLKTLAEVLRAADLVVCPDTGPMHLAAAVGTPVVALFGPTAPWRTGPFGPGHTVLRTKIECSPCFRKSCGEPRCMTGLEPDMVYQAVTACLEKRGLEV